MKEEKAWISAFVPKSTKEWIEDSAKKENRSVSNFVEKLLTFEANREEDNYQR